MADTKRELIEERIAAIDAKLASGISSVTTDGTTTAIDLAALRAERADLRQQLGNMRQPVSASINLRFG